jgi:hypothetical protein
MQTLWQDLRYGARMLMKQPGFTLIVVLTLALGIGANGVIFSLVNALLLRPLPVDKPAELAAVFTSDFSSGDFGGSSYPDYAAFRDRNQSFSGLALYAPQPFSLNLDGANERAFGEIVSGNYFDVLGLRPALGRGFLPAEDQTPGAAPVVVVSHKVWQTRFGGAADILGRNIKLNGQPLTIVGVAPENYQGLMRGLAVDWWVPAMMMDQLAPGSNNLTERGNRGMMLMGRLKPSVTLAQAQADFSNLAAQLYREFPQQWENIRRQGRTVSVLPESQSRVLPQARLPITIFAALLLGVAAQGNRRATGAGRGAPATDRATADRKRHARVARRRSRFAAGRVGRGFADGVQTTGSDSAGTPLAARLARDRLSNGFVIPNRNCVRTGSGAGGDAA